MKKLQKNNTHSRSEKTLNQCIENIRKPFHLYFLVKMKEGFLCKTI